MTFDQIVVVDRTLLTGEGLEQLQLLSRARVRSYSDDPSSEEEIMGRIRDADCVLVSWRTPISAQVLRAAQRLQYVGMCCSLYDAASANVDIDAAQSLGITVCGVRHYGDQGVVEFILAQLISLCQGLGRHQWQEGPTELSGKVLGIIGLGTTGQLVARAAHCLGVEVVYYSRTRKPALEGPALRYAPLEDLLSQADAVTTHLPRNTCLLDAGGFARMRPDTVLINTSLGPTFDVPAFCSWIERGTNYAIFDADGATGHAELFSRYPNVVVSDRAAGGTAEARRRLTGKVLDNLRRYLGQEQDMGRPRSGMGAKR